MRRVPLLLALGVALLAHLAPARAEAASVYGTWRSSTGNLFEITESRRGGFKLRVTNPDGTQLVLRGDWVPGMEGSQFNYWNGPHQYTATFNPRDPNRVRVVVGQTVSWWQRHSHAVAVPVHKAKVFGLWRSTSGNVFEITEAKRHGFKLWVTYANGTRTVLRGDWVRGMAGMQFTYWDGKFQYTGTFSPDDPDRVRVQAGKVTSWWQRDSGAPVAAPPPPPPPPPPYDCWQRHDPGCYRTKGGNLPMDRAAWASFHQLVSSSRPHVYPMLDRVKSGIGSGYLTSRQLVTLLELFKPHVYPMLDVVKVLAPRLVDPEYGAGPVAEAFRPHTHVGSQAAGIVGAQRSDPPRRR